MERAPSQPRFGLASFRPLLRPMPCTGQLWIDVVFLLLVAGLHNTILPAMFGRYVLVDVMTPWLVCTFVAAPLLRSIILVVLGALLLETRAACPAGMYIAAYWVIMSALWLSRSTLSWRHAFPWAVTFFVSELWVIAFETFVMAVGEGSLHFSFTNLLHQCVRLVLSTFIGMSLSQRLMTLGLGEDATT